MTTNAAAAPLRILLIEDEAVIALTAEDMIEEIGHQVVAQVASVNDALARVGDDGYDLALLDINLNGVMSTPVAEALLAAGKPFIFTTGYGSAGSKGEFSDVVVVAKPYTMSTLSEAINAAAERAGLLTSS